MPERDARACARRAVSVFERRDGVWRFLTPRRAACGSSRSCASIAPSASAKATAPSTPEYYRELPIVAPDDPHAGRVAHPARELRTTCSATCCRRSGVPIRVARPRRRQRLAVAPAGGARPSRRRRRPPRRRGGRTGRVPSLPDVVRRGAGRLRRAAVRAAAVRPGRVQRVAALRARPRRDAGRARSGMLAPGGALVVMDSPMFRARPRRARRWSTTACAASRPSYGLARRRAARRRLSDVRARWRAIAERLGLRRRVRPVARTARLAAAPAAGARAAAARAGGVRPVGGPMIVLYNPLSTTPGKQPLPLSLMSLAAGAREATRARWSLVDGNVVADPAAEIIERLSRRAATELALLAVTVMPGPQLTQAVRSAGAVASALPHVPIVWGGYFPTQHTDTVLRVAVRRLRRPVAGRAAAAAAGRRAADRRRARAASAGCRGRTARRADRPQPDRRR